MIRRLPPNLQFTMPTSALTLEGFRQWIRSGTIPKSIRASFLSGELHLDMNPEWFYSHNQIRAAANQTLSNLVSEEDLGKYCPAGLWFTDDESELSTEADATFLSWERLESGAVQLVPQREGGDGIEMRGSPDGVLEVVSDSSERKDTVRLLDLYYRARVREYWLIDARGEAIQFTVYRRGENGFVAAPPQGDWRSSEVFGRAFLLTRTRDRIGGWSCSLEMR
jgi:Uma2 family endonuclease